MKKIITIVLTVLLLAAVLNVSVFALTGGAEVTGAAQAKPGDTVEVVLSLSGYANVTGIGVHFTVPAGLELKDGQWLEDGTATDVNLQKNQAVWASDAAVDMTQKTQVMKLTFQVLELEAGQTELQCDVVFDKLTVEDSYAKVSLDPVTASVAVSMPSGDMNADGKVNDQDAMYLLRYTLIPSRYPISVDGDVNSDGKVNDQDAMYLLRYTLIPSRYPLYPNNN